jgi:hypothetical protein
MKLSETCPAGNVVIDVPTAALAIGAYAPNLIRDGTDRVTGDVHIRVDDAPVGRSDARLTPAGCVLLEAERVADRGRGGEAQLKQTLQSKLRQDFPNVTIIKGSDADGEDGLVEIAGRTLVVQIVTSPSAPDFWRTAKEGLVTERVNLSDAAVWLHATINAKFTKIPETQRAATLLAIDARHAGILATTPALDRYVQRFGDPVAEFGFASVWIVGPTEDYCSRLGAGVPGRERIRGHKTEISASRGVVLRRLPVHPPANPPLAPDVRQRRAIRRALERGSRPLPSAASSANYGRAQGVARNAPGHDRQ